MGPEKKTMTANDVSIFIDQAEVNTFVTIKSRKRLERVFQIDNKSPQFKKLAEIKKSASVSELSRVKNELFLEIEKKLIKISEDLDAVSNVVDLVKYDPSVGTDHYSREMKEMTDQLEKYKKDKEKICTSTPEFENLSRTNSVLQKTLSGIVLAFNTPGTCMYDFKIFKDKDGSVDLRQLDAVAPKYKEMCKKM